jgi:NADH:ubiquinone oxidoreductase subunit E
MKNKIKITLCLGSSCFARGNGRTLEKVRAFLEENKLNDQVEFNGKLCAGDCSNGPIIEIGAEKYGGINESNIIEILEQHIVVDNAI